MIRIDALTLRRGTKVLLKNATAVIQPGEKVGLVGPNGAGKTSLFLLLRRELGPDAGDISIPPTWRISYVAQDEENVHRLAVEHVIDGDARIRDLERQIADAEHAHERGEDQAGEVLGELHAAYSDAGGYTVRSRAESLLLGLGFTLAQIQTSVAEFSGGWRMRLNLARALMSPAELLLLDEPTNHLDLDAIVWLEQWLRRFEGTLVVVSHDREFLDAVCNVTLHIDGDALKRYGGNYTAFERMRSERILQDQAAFQKQQREIAHLQKFVDRFKATASKAKQAQSRVKALERMDIVSPTLLGSPFTFRFREPATAPDPMLVCESLECGYQTDNDPKPIVGPINLTLRTGERIGLLGANGQGKSTLIKTLAGTLERLSGSLIAAKGLSIGYFAQHQIDTLRLDESALHQLARIAPTTREQELRDYLGSFDFRGEMATSIVRPFSGGEKARLALALLIWLKPNLLLLDEPTNHLDLETREALTLALAQFEGTLILVSHDRALLRSTTDQFLLVAGGHVETFDGDLEDYKQWLLGRFKNDSKVVAEKAPAPEPAPIPEAAKPTDAARRNQKRSDAASRTEASQKRRPIESRIKRIEEKLARLAEQKAALESTLGSTKAYEESERQRLTQLLLDQAYVTKEIAELEEEWVESHALLEGLAA